MKWFYNLRTASKLLLGFSVLGILTVFIGMVSVRQLGIMNGRLDDMYSNQLLAVKPLLEAKSDFNFSRNELRKLYMVSGSNRAATIQSFRDTMSAIDKKIEVFKHTELSRESEAQLPVLETSLDRYSQGADEILQAAAANQNDRLLQLMNSETGNYVTGRSGALAALDKLVDINIQEAEQARQDGKNAYSSSQLFLYVVIAAVILIVLALGIFISNAISRPLKQMVGLVKRVAEGDLRDVSGINTKDEVGAVASGVDEMILNLRGIVGHISQNAETLASASQQISATSEEIAGSNTNQAESAQKINELFKELTDVIHSVAMNTEHASELSEQSVREADKGTDIIRSSMSSMNDVQDRMGELENDSLVIGNIVEVIEEIADQTNLLALNAAIEAARAGEQGRGFAVVADEVRKLAERSSTATKEITGIIKGIQENTRRSVNTVQESVAYSHKTGESFVEIQKMVGEAGSKVTEIAAASEEQSAQASSVMRAVESISAATEEAAAASEEMAATAQSLSQMAVELQNSIGMFKLDRARSVAVAGQPGYAVEYQPMI